MEHPNGRQNRGTGMGRPSSATKTAANVGTDILPGARRPPSSFNTRYSAIHKRDK